jgi:hypothetical protein
MRAPFSVFAVRTGVQKFEGDSRATRLLVRDRTEIPARALAASYDDELTQRSYEDSPRLGREGIPRFP